MSFALRARRVLLATAAAVAISSFATSQNSTDRVFGYPQVNGVAVDNCAVWANDCGWGGAHQYCKTQGYAGARSFQLFNAGRTYVIGSQRVCEGGSCVGFSQIVCMNAAALGSGDRAFDAPQANGMAVDNCAVWANDCGWGGAHQYCRTQGYAAAKSFTLYNPGRTYVIGAQRVCEGASCVGFSQVICTNGGAQPPQPPGPLGVITVTSATYGRNCQVPPGNATAHIATACNGKTVCEYKVDVGALGDPAYGCQKTYDVQWSCGGGAPGNVTVEAEAGFGRVATLRCPVQ